MPVIRIEYDDPVVNEADARSLCEAAQRVVIDATGIKEVLETRTRVLGYISTRFGMIH